MNYKNTLINEILPFWLNNAVDYKNGGIYTCLDKTVKFTVQIKAVGFKVARYGVLLKPITPLIKTPNI